MWTLIDGIYDLTYFILRNLENFKIEALLFYVFYLFGKRSGMKMFKRFLTGHFPYLADENEDWRKWATNQIEFLGGRKWQPTKQYGAMKRLKKQDRKNSTTSLTLSLEGTDPGRLLKMKKVVINAGHGGKDGGAIGYSKKLEKDFNLSVALKVEEKLINNPQIEVNLTRRTDVFVELLDISKHANDYGADCFVSIHANSAVLSMTSGTETLYTNPISKSFAELMHPLILEVTGGKDRKAKYQNLSVCRNTKMPAILLEPEFISNQKSEAMLFDPLFQDKLAGAIARGICLFLGVEYTTTAPVKPVTPPAITPAGTYPVGIVIGETTILGFIIDSRAWVPARDLFDNIKAAWSFVGKSILIGGVAVETIIIGGKSYIKSIDVQNTGLGKVFLDPDAVNTKRVYIYPTEVPQ
jgi:N-acetylmuramoyl-L-alanine amidase